MIRHLLLLRKKIGWGEETCRKGSETLANKMGRNRGARYRGRGLESEIGRRKICVRGEQRTDLRPAPIIYDDALKDFSYFKSCNNQGSLD